MYKLIPLLLLFAGCSGTNATVIPNSTPMQYKTVADVPFAAVYEVKIDGVDYLIAKCAEGVSIIPKVKSDAEKPLSQNQRLRVK